MKETIFDFEDYREFIQIRMGELNQISSQKYSLRACSRRLGCAPSYFHLIVKKKRHLSVDMVYPLAKILGLPSAQRRALYFHTLSATTRDREAKKYFRTILKQLHNLQRDPMPVLNATDESVYWDWVRMALRSLVRLKDFQPDTTWMCRRLGVTASRKDEIGAAFNLLVKNKIIVRSKDGRWDASSKLGSGMAGDLSSFDIYKAGLARTQTALQDPYVARPCQFYFMSVALDRATEEKAIRKFIDFRQDLLALEAESGPAENVFMNSNNFFCVTPIDSAESAVKP